MDNWIEQNDATRTPRLLSLEQTVRSDMPYSSIISDLWIFHWNWNFHDIQWCSIFSLLFPLCLYESDISKIRYGPEILTTHFQVVSFNFKVSNCVRWLCTIRVVCHPVECFAFKLATCVIWAWSLNRQIGSWSIEIVAACIPSSNERVSLGFIVLSWFKLG